MLQKAAKLIRNDVLEFGENCRELNWPPSTQELQKRDRDIPRSVISFLEGVLKPPGHSFSDKIQRYIQSYASDLVHGVIQGKLITLKHFLLGFGLHNLTVQKIPKTILSHFGHCVDYKSVCETETAQAEIAQLLYNEGITPGLHTESDDEYVFTSGLTISIRR